MLKQLVILKDRVSNKKEFRFFNNFFKKDYLKVEGEGYVITPEGLNTQEKLRQDLMVGRRINHDLGMMTRFVIRGQRFESTGNKL